MTSKQERGRLAKWLDAERVELMVGRLKRDEQELIAMLARVRQDGNVNGARVIDEMLGAVTRAIIMGDKLIKEKQI